MNNPSSTCKHVQPENSKYKPSISNVEAFSTKISIDKMRVKNFYVLRLLKALSPRKAYKLLRLESISNLHNKILLMAWFAFTKSFPAVMQQALARHSKPFAQHLPSIFDSVHNFALEFWLTTFAFNIRSSRLIWKCGKTLLWVMFSSQFVSFPPFYSFNQT